MLAWLLVGHLAGDFLLQNRWMADGKAVHPVPLLVHSAVYTAAVCTASLAAGGLDWRGVLLVFAAHAVLDQRRFVAWWCKVVMRCADIPYLPIMADQAWHAVVLALASLLFAAKGSL